jgi:hypothetical protein
MGAARAGHGRAGRAVHTGPRKQLPHKQLETLLQDFTDCLEKEHALVFGHNLGVHSGTAVIEDVIVRKLYEQCKRAVFLITNHDSCMETFFLFCERLSPAQRNRMLTAFLDFDENDLLVRSRKAHTNGNSSLITRPQ